MTRLFIQFTPELLAELKKAYAKAVSDGKDAFMFHRQPMMVVYAKYLIEYLDNRALGDRSSSITHTVKKKP